MVFSEWEIIRWFWVNDFFFYKEIINKYLEKCDYHVLWENRLFVIYYVIIVFFEYLFLVFILYYDLNYVGYKRNFFFYKKMRDI